ncbi:MAG: type II toxin-antitoxin system RelE/ParE family toxin [Mariprofundaceae bacterium]|nr:type II toxin-antitoxin system RelE/ParE family toxin [Mariprofundaceae bacterium]
MPPYELTHHAEEDLKGIARYTLKQWGRKQSMHYAETLERCFLGISSGTVHSYRFSQRYCQVEVVHCQHHYVFFIHSDKKPPVIIAVLHERMDMLVWLRNRII